MITVILTEEAAVGFVSDLGKEIRELAELRDCEYLKPEIRYAFSERIVKLEESVKAFRVGLGWSV
jgi:hypothetical protein